VVLAGLGGVVLRGDSNGLSFRASTRPDRRSISAVLETTHGGLLVFGEFGAEPMHPDPR
jgi:hypothetical protein